MYTARRRVQPIQLVVYKQESKAKERRGEEQQRRLKLYTICKSRDCNCLPFTAAICRFLPFSASAVTISLKILTNSRTLFSVIQSP